VLLSGNVQSKHLAAGVRIQTNIYYLNINNLRLCRAGLLSGNVQSENIAAVKVFKQRYYRNVNALRLFRPVLLSGIVQSEHVATGESVQRMILSEPEQIKPL